MLGDSKSSLAMGEKLTFCPLSERKVFSIHPEWATWEVRITRV